MSASPSPDPRPLPRWSSPFDDWAEALARPVKAAATRLVPAEVCRRGKAQPVLDAALAAGEIRADATADDEGDEAMTLFLDPATAAVTLDRLGDEVAVLSLGRPRSLVPAQPEPAAGSRAPAPPLRKDVPVVAVIDDGIGWLNQRFCRRNPGAAADAPLRTRFHAVWLQSFAISPQGAQVVGGRILRRAEIDVHLALGERLEEETAYRRLNAQLYDPETPRMSSHSTSHGTHTLDLAAGADPCGADPARDWPLLAVQLPPEAGGDTAGAALGPTVGGGGRWCLKEARAMGGTGPLIINISYATFAGPKDGTKAVEAQIARAVDQWQARTGRQARVVLAWGNARRSRQAARLVLTPGNPAQALDWRLPPDDYTASYLEFRPDQPADLDRLALVLTPPGPGAAPQVIGPIPPDTFLPVTDAAGRPAGRFARVGPRVTAPGITTPAHAVLAMAPTEEDGPRPRAPHGAWGLSLSAGGTRPLALRLEVQRDDTAMGYRQNGRQSRLDHPLAEGRDDETAGQGAPGPGCPVTFAGTHSSFVTSPSPCLIAVAAARADNLSPARYSAEGAAWTKAGPEIAALGDRGPARPGLAAAATHSGGARMLDGTSAAAARASRVLALHLSGPAPHPAPGPAEIAALVAGWGVAASAADAARVGAGVLTAPADPPRL